MISRTVDTFFFGIALLSLLSCQRGEQRPMSEATGKETPSQESWNSTVILSVRGQNRAKVWAGHILKFEESHIIKMDERIQVDFFDDNGNHVSVLTADGGAVNEISQNLTAFGNVLVLSEGGSRLKTEKLEWHNESQRILSDTLVTIQSGDEEITGVGFESDADLEHWKIKENITGVVKRRVTGEP
ncbi:MAG: LPS export ABC transporter periplasmic protein LptC [Gemmatimonadota bacterium]|nr:MAG: LPS export ABC transporter periplasmic protein LptC [Gemmatimonadota bacterium]